MYTDTKEARHDCCDITRLCAVCSAVGGALVCLPAAAPLAADAGGKPCLLCRAVLAGIAGTAGLHLSGLVVRAQNSREGHLLCRAGGCAFSAAAAQISACGLRVAGQAGQCAGHRLLYAAAYKLSLLCAPRQASAGGKVCAAAVLCLVFSLHHAGPLQPLR